MKKVKWHETLKQARAYLKTVDPRGLEGMDVFKWKFTKRKKPFFVGTELEWLNV